MSSTPDARIGLREQQKIRTRDSIRRHAMELFAAQGYTKTTVEQIAEAAGVSHTTFFRYFVSKEQVVIADDTAERVARAIADVEPGLSHFDLLRHMVTELHHLCVEDPWAGDQQRWQLIRSEPALHAPTRAESERVISEWVQAFADYIGVESDSFALNVFLWASAGVAAHLSDVIGNPADPESLRVMLDAIDLLEAGLPLGRRP